MKDLFYDILIDFLNALPILIIGWISFSIIGSAFKIGKNNCGKSYPIDYVIYTNAFCEIKGE